MSSQGHNKLRGLGGTGLLLLWLGTAVHAQDRLDEAMSTSQQTSRAAQSSQRRIDRLSDETRELLEKYRAELWRGQQLQLYIRQLEATISQQELKKTTLSAQLESLEATREALVPLLLRMVDSLEAFIALDLPFLQEERSQRIERLRKILTDPALPVSEQYRRVLEAYQVEADYGRSLEAYRAPLASRSESRLVDYLRIGRTALYYLSLDGSEGGLWDPRRETWDPLPTGSVFALKQGIRIAREQAAPEMLALPVPGVRQ